jgi:oligopeptide/dipeptide ABC transporter ATP-binding protein
LNVVRLLCDRVVVMYLGRVVETGPAQAVFSDPRHPYTRALVGAIPGASRGGGLAPVRLSGEVKSPIDPDPNACRFHGRCPMGEARCAAQMPALEGRGDARQVACHLVA